MSIFLWLTINNRSLEREKICNIPEFCCRTFISKVSKLFDDSPVHISFVIWLSISSSTFWGISLSKNKGIPSSELKVWNKSSERSKQLQFVISLNNKMINDEQTLHDYKH